MKWCISKFNCIVAFAAATCLGATDVHGGETTTHKPPVFARYRPMLAADWNWTAWAADRFVPFSGPMDGTDPIDAATEISLASAAGLDGFLMEFDVKDGLPVKHEVVEQGFLCATNRSAVKFAALYTGESAEGLVAFAEYVAGHWANSPEYLKKGGKAVVVNGGGASLQRQQAGNNKVEVKGIAILPLESFARVPVEGKDFEKRLKAAAASTRPILVESWNFAAPGSDVALFPTMRQLSQSLHACRRALGHDGGRLPMVAMWSFWNRSLPHGRAYDYPAPDMTISYGENWRQTIDLWFPKDEDGSVLSGPTPIALCIHGGGWNSGNPHGAVEENIRKCHARGVAFGTVSYRLIQDATRDHLSPPVRYPLEDALAATRHLKVHAAEFGLDPARILLFGGSAGACSSLYVGFQNDCELGIKAIYADVPQTSMDPAEVVEWIPNMSYGGHAFGYRDFKSFLAERDKWVEWIDRYSPAALVRRCTPANAPVVFYHANPLPPEGQLPKDTAHAGMFCVKFKEICDAQGVLFRPGSLADALEALFH